MSTILQALQKTKFNKTGGSPVITQQKNKARYFNIALLSALLIIIALLSTLIYLLLNPHSEERSASTATVELTQPALSNHLVKVFFDTKPLPAPVAEVKKIIQAKVINQEKQVLPVIEQPKSGQSKDQHMAIEEVPSDLQKRFERALLLTDIEQNENPNGEFNEEEEDIRDVSDIHDMSGNFQNKVPLIRYDLHMYSSVIDERWVRINGETLKEGDFDSTGKLELLEIQPQRSIFRLERQSFSLESLSDWKGR